MKKLVWSAPVVVGILLTTQTVFAQPFAVDTLAQSPGVSFPAAFSFVPGNEVRFFFIEKNSGNIRIFEHGAVRPKPFAVVNVTGVGEQGLLGIALHPEYPDSPFVYVRYTRAGDRANVVARLRDSSSFGVQLRTLVVVPRLTGTSSYNGGNLHFGPDGKLYCSFGDYAPSPHAQDSARTNLAGKILRLNPDGSLPADNPFAGTLFWSIGHRNSFDFTWDPLTGKMYSSENGPSCSAINLVPARGNMGWPLEGNCLHPSSTEFVRPLYLFPFNPPALTGIVVYRGKAFPRLNGHLLAGNSAGTIWSVQLTETGDTIMPGSISKFFSYTSGLGDLAVGPDDNLYVTSGPHSTHRLLRVRPVEPSFTSAPPADAVQDKPYSYTPTFSGTPPALSIITGPDGMTLDSTTWTIHWLPANAHALQRHHPVVLRAENGAGIADQQFVITVANVNDPPGPFLLTSPPADTTFTFTNTTQPTVFCAWSQSFDPDLDTVRYTVQLDTVDTFDSPALRDTLAGANHSLQVVLPRKNRTFFWRVRATDGEMSLFSTGTRRFGVSILTAAYEGKGKEKEEEPQAAVLEQNFPNPFNPTTNILYTIPKGGYVRLAVFNLLGQEVARIFEGIQSAGTYEVTFNKEELPTGIYFYRIQAPGFVETRKMVITK